MLFIIRSGNGALAYPVLLIGGEAWRRKAGTNIQGTIAQNMKMMKIEAKTKDVEKETQRKIQQTRVAIELKKKEDKANAKIDKSQKEIMFLTHYFFLLTLFFKFKLYVLISTMSLRSD